MSILPPSPRLSLFPYVIPCHLSHLSSFLLRPCGCGPITPLPNPTFRVGLHTRPSSYSVIPGGSARSLPYPKVLSWPGHSQSQEAVIEAGWWWLDIVSAIMGMSCNELKARRFADETVRRSITSAISCTTIQRLRLQIVRSHADAKLSMQFLGSAAVVVLSICRHFSIFVSIDGRAKLPTVKFQQIFWFPGYASVFEISWFITNSFLFPSLFRLVPGSSKSNDSRGLLHLCYDKGFVVTLLYSLVFCV
jgi:hypothetical protein